MQNLSYENEFDLQENDHVGGISYEWFRTGRLVLTQRQNASRTWPIGWTISGEKRSKKWGQEMNINVILFYFSRI